MKNDTYFYFLANQGLIFDTIKECKPVKTAGELLSIDNFRYENDEAKVDCHYEQGSYSVTLTYRMQCVSQELSLLQM